MSLDQTYFMPHLEWEAIEFPVVLKNLIFEQSIFAFDDQATITLWREANLQLKGRLLGRLKDPKTNVYKNYPYPAFIGVPFNPETDEYPYPPAAINMTYDGLHPSDKGFRIIANMLVKIMRKY